MSRARWIDGARSLADGPLASNRNRTAAGALALAVVVAISYGNTLSGYFLGDDFANVVSAAAFPLTRWPALFISDVSGEVWAYSLRMLRPFAALAGILQTAVFGGDAYGYHVTSLALHLVNVWLVWAIADRLLSPARWAAFGAALLFAVHPSHVEAVAWIAGQSDLLPTTFLLGAFLAFLCFRRAPRLLPFVGLTLLTGLALFTKENTVVLPLLMGGYDLVQPRRIRTARSGPHWPRYAAPYLATLLMMAIYFGCRRLAFGAAVPEASLAGMLATTFGVIPMRYADYVGHLLWPLDFSFAADWPVPGKVHLLLPFLLLFVVVPLLLGSLKHAAAGGRRYRLFFPGLIWFAATSLPFLLSYSSARHLYLVSAGFCIFLVTTIQTMPGGRARLVQSAAVGLLACLWLAGVRHECRPWRSAGAITREFHGHLAKLAGKPAGTAVVVNVPAWHGQIATLAWSVPFALEAPLFMPPLKDHFVMLTNPPCYFAPHAWAKNPAIGSLRGLDPAADAYMITFDYEKRRLRIRQVAPERVRAAADNLHASLAAKAGPPFDAQWFTFVAALQEPAQ